MDLYLGEKEYLFKYLTFCDLYLIYILKIWEKLEVYMKVSEKEKLLQNFPRLITHRKRIENLEGLSQYLKKDKRSLEYTISSPYIGKFDFWYKLFEYNLNLLIN